MAFGPSAFGFASAQPVGSAAYQNPTAFNNYLSYGATNPYYGQMAFDSTLNYANYSPYAAVVTPNVSANSTLNASDDGAPTYSAMQNAYATPYFFQNQCWWYKMISLCEYKIVLCILFLFYLPSHSIILIVDKKEWINKVMFYGLNFKIE